MFAYITWNVDREILTLFGPIALRWYSLLFAGGIIFGYYFFKNTCIKAGKNIEYIDSLLFHIVIGTIVGARLGHCLFYEPQTYLSDPIKILKVWEGGLASHGGYAGVIIAVMLFFRKCKEYPFFWLLDRISVGALFSGGCIRLGNFFNSEIVGRPADVPWAVYFQKIDPHPMGRHPTQIYESLGFFASAYIVYLVYKAYGDKEIPQGRLAGLALILGFSHRIFVEFFKVNQETFQHGMPLNMGQLLSVPFILLGVLLFTGAHRNLKFLAPLLAQTPTTPQAAADTPQPKRHSPKKRPKKRKSK